MARGSRRISALADGRRGEREPRGARPHSGPGPGGHLRADRVRDGYGGRGHGRGQRRADGEAATLDAVRRASGPAAGRWRGPAPRPRRGSRGGWTRGTGPAGGRDHWHPGGALSRPPTPTTASTIQSASALVQTSMRRSVPLTLDDLDARRKGAAQVAGDLEAHGVVTPHPVSHADDRRRHRRSMSSVRKCVAQEMHGS